MRQILKPLAASFAALLAAGAVGAGEQEPVANAAIDALAAELRIPREQIEVDMIRAVDWPNSSLGCPKPGVAYLDVITPGHQVTLRANGEVYVVHEAGNRAVICRGSLSLTGAMTQARPVYNRQMAEARADLAGRLNVPQADIVPVSGEMQTWNDAALGCPDPGTSYAQAQVTGWVLTLRHGTRDYTYHTDLQRTIPCPPIAAE